MNIEQHKILAEINSLETHEREELLLQLLQGFRPENPLEKIEAFVCSYYGISQTLLKSKLRKKEIVLGRHLVMYLARKRTKESTGAIGIYCYRDHATVIHACRKIEKLIKEKQEIKKDIETINSYLDNNTQLNKIIPKETKRIVSSRAESVVKKKNTAYSLIRASRLLVSVRYKTTIEQPSSWRFLFLAPDKRIDNKYTASFNWCGTAFIGANLILVSINQKSITEVPAINDFSIDERLIIDKKEIIERIKEALKQLLVV